MSQRNRYEFENHNSVPLPLLKVIVELIRQWDDVDDAKNLYLSKFDRNVTVKLGNITLRGYEDIKRYRAATINPIKGPILKVAHQFESVFLLAGQGQREKRQELIFTSSVAYTLESGTVLTESCSSRAVMGLKNQTGEYKIEYYEIYINQEALSKGHAEIAN
jgi:hypothetical protein